MKEINRLRLQKLEPIILCRSLSVRAETNLMWTRTCRLSRRSMGDVYETRLSEGFSK